MVKILLDPEDIKHLDYAIVLIYANNCHHCQTIKPIFDQYEEEFGEEITFLSAEISTVKSFYDQFAETQEAFGYETNEDGSPKQDESGNFIAQKLLNPDGSPQLVPKYVIPNFYVFAKELQDEDNEFGFAGGFDGGNPDEVYGVLQALQQKALGG